LGLATSTSTVEEKFNTSGIGTAKVSNIFMYIPLSLKQPSRTVGFAPALEKKEAEHSKSS